MCLLDQVLSPQYGTQNPLLRKQTLFPLTIWIWNVSHIEYLVLNVTMFRDEAFGRRVWVPRTLTSLADWPMHGFIVGWTIPR